MRNRDEINLYSEHDQPDQTDPCEGCDWLELNLKSCPCDLKCEWDEWKEGDEYE